MKLLTLPEGARRAFWVALRAYLRPTLDDEAQRAITSYCEEHGVTPVEIAPPIKATRHLFREGARTHATKEDLSADVHGLVDEEDARELLALLLPWFEDLQPQLRRELVRETVTDHGKLVAGTRWRIERIVASDRADGVDATLAAVTFSYVEGGEPRRITLHFMPDQVAALRDAANEILR